MFVMVVHLRTHAHAGLLGWCRHTGGLGNTRCSGSVWPSHVVAMWRCNCLSVVHLGHPSHSSAPEARVLVAVAPAVNGSLDQTSLATETRVELCQGPADRIAFRLVVETVTFVRLLVAACARVDTVLRLEFLGQLVDVDGLDVAADGVLHLHPVATVLERNPLHAVLVLPYNEGRGCRNGTGRSVGVDVCRRGSAIVHAWGADGRGLGRWLRRAQSRGRSLEGSLRHARLWASRHSRGLRMGLVRVVHLLALLVGHEEGVCGHGLLLLLG